MPTYVYACKEKDHERVEVKHGMKENPVVRCERCGAQMYRVIQRPAAIAFNAGEILTEWMTENYNRWRTKSPRFNKDHVTRPGKPIPATNSNGGKRK